MSRKRLSELTIKDNFLSAAVMLKYDNCKHLLEMVLRKKIKDIRVIREKSIVYHPEYHGIRLDVAAEDEENAHYDVEMQVVLMPVLKRSRYYHSQMDMEMLRTGEPYENLSNSYVIFICDYDPFDRKKYQYTLENSCKEQSMRSRSAGIWRSDT